MIFSRNPHKRAKSLFNLIAPAYSALDRYVKKGFRKAINNIQNEVDITGKSVLDIGTGSGAWAALYKEYGAAKVHGVDFAHKMIKKAGNRYSPDITFSVGDAENLTEFDDNSFDIVTTSFVLHGMKEDKRKMILAEMKRISKKHVIINDYYGKTPIVAQFLEFMEMSDYKYFKKNFTKELASMFPQTKREKASFGTSVYFATK